MAGINAEGFIGLEEVKARLEEIYGKLSGAIFRDAIYAAANVYRDEIQARTPIGKTLYSYRYGHRTVRIRHKPGTARRSVIVYQRRRLGELYRGEDQLSLLVGHEKKQAFYAYFLEYGTKNQPARGFMRGAYDAVTPAALETAKTILEAGLRTA